MSRDDMLAVLRGNFGFDNPEEWVSFAEQHDFGPVEVDPIDRCPDCDGAPAGTLGRYVHCSSLLSILECAVCGLFWSNGRVEDALRFQHFEVAYKSATYFRHDRRAIFEHLADLATEAAPAGGSILDVGGATGQMLAHIRLLRPDLHLVLQDISAQAVERACSELSLEATDASLADLAALGRRFDVVVLSDVIYYEADIRTMWDAVGLLVKPGGAVIIRVPNKLGLIRASSMAKRLPWARRNVERLARLRFYNTEHALICTRGYLHRRLQGLGFGSVTTVPSPVLGSGTLPATVGALSRLVHRATVGRLVMSPSMVVYATDFSR